MSKQESETVEDIVNEIRDVDYKYGTKVFGQIMYSRGDLADRIEAAHNREVAELLDSLIELAECGVYSCCGQCTRRGCPGEEHCCETRDGMATLQRARKMLAKAKGKAKKEGDKNAQTGT